MRIAGQWPSLPCPSRTQITWKAPGPLERVWWDVMVATEKILAMWLWMQRFLIDCISQEEEQNIMKSCFYWFVTIFFRQKRLHHGSTIIILIIPVNEVLRFPPFSQTSTNPDIKQPKTDHLHNQLVTFQIKHPGDSGHLPVIRQLGQQKVVLKGSSWNLVTLVAWDFKPTMLKSPGSPKV